MKEYSYGVCPYKITNNGVQILLNKTSLDSPYNFFKGKISADESIRDAAIREFYEEAGVLLDVNLLENYFFQSNKRKDVGIFLYDFTEFSGSFKYQKEEIKYAEWVDIFSIYPIEISNNQKRIYDEIFLYFKMRLDKIKHIIR